MISLNLVFDLFLYAQKKLNNIPVKPYDNMRGWRETFLDIISFICHSHKLFMLIIMFNFLAPLSNLDVINLSFYNPNGA